MAKIHCILTKGAEFKIIYDDISLEITSIYFFNNTNKKMRFEISSPKIFSYELTIRELTVSIPIVERVSFTKGIRDREGELIEVLKGVDWRMSLGV